MTTPPLILPSSVMGAVRTFAWFYVRSRSYRFGKVFEIKDIVPK